MSAQALLSLLTPAAPTANRDGVSAEPSDVEGLFASLLVGELSEGADEVVPDGDDESANTAGFLVGPAIIVPAPATLFVGDDASEMEAPAQSTASPVPTTPQLDEPTLPAAPPQLALPIVTVASGPRLTAANDATLANAPAPEDAEVSLDIAPPEPSEDKAASPTPAAAAPTVPPAPATPVPLRPLAERTAKALDPDNGETSAAPSTPDSTTAARSDSGPVHAGKQTTPADPLTLTADAGARSDDPVLAGPASDRTTEGAESVHAIRDVALINISRAAIDATAQIAAQIIRKLDARSTRFEMALTPDDLGRVDVKLDIDSEGRLAARLAFDNPAAATDLRGRADELRRQLEAQGFHLADDAFQFAQRDSGSHAFDRGHDPRQGRSRAFSAAARLNAETDTPVQPPRWTPLSLSPSGVDMKV